MVIAIIGVGLIGGSIGFALKSKTRIIGIGRNIGRLKIAKKLGAVDEITTDIKKGVRDADVIFVCLPVGLIAKTVKKILPFCKRNAIITDVGSVKFPIVKEVERFLSTSHFFAPGEPTRPLPASCRFVGGHPIAGSEKTSVKHASKDLFKNAPVILTPTNKTDKKSLDIVKKLWEKMKAKIKIMSPVRHDKILSMISHLPHIIAFTLVNSADNFEFAGNGFKDTTRIAASSPGMWADIIFHNRVNVKKAIKKFKNELAKIENVKTEKELAGILRTAKLKRDRYWR